MRKHLGSYDTALAVVVLVAALVLRLWNLSTIPLLHDELSSLVRVDFASFGEMLEKGVAIDAHPALTQAFLWWWAPLTEGNNFALRLPFVLCGWGAVVVMWRFVDLAGDRFRANLVAAVLGAGQLFIFHSEMARPYGPGLLFTALYTLAWYKWISGGNRSKKNMVALAVWMALAAYTHYFALLTVGVVWLCGLIYARKAARGGYFLHVLLAVVLFLPHFRLFFVQLGHGGIGGPDGWLRPPRFGDLLEWFQELFNYNVFLSAAAVVSWVFALVRFVALDRKRGGFFALMWAVFGGVFLVGFAYSHVVNPVMYILPMSFALPYVCVALTWPWTPRYVAVRACVPVAISGLMVFSLFHSRDHYGWMAKQPVDFAVRALTQEPASFLSVSGNPRFIEYTLRTRYVGEGGVPEINNYFGTLTLNERARVLADYRGGSYISDGVDADLDYVVSLRFPHVVEMVEGFTFTGWKFTEGDDNSEEYFPTWAEGRPDHRGNEEFFGIIEIPLDTIALNFGNEIRTAVHFGDTLPENMLLVYDLKRGGENLHWSAANPQAHAVGGEAPILVKNLLLWDIFNTPESMEGARLSIYLWNRDREDFAVSGYVVQKLKTNPNRYGSFGRRP